MVFFWLDYLPCEKPIMPDLYSKEIQLELLDKLAGTPGATPVIDTEIAWDWNHSYLLQQGWIRQIHSGPPGAEMLIGEELTDVGKAMRFDLRERLQQERECRAATKTQRGLCWMTLAILGLTAVTAVSSVFLLSGIAF